MSNIKCPACWNEISEESTICPKCGFRLKNEDSTLKSEEYNQKIENIIVNKGNDRKEEFRDKGKKDRKIITASIICIALIFFVAFINNGFGKHKDKSSSHYTYSEDTTYYATTGNEGALNKAKSYLRSSAFSYTGLIEQLEYEGFSSSEATYGADNCGADWNEQALLKAKSYISSSAFSESGLKEQLIYEGFSEDEAEYGVRLCGANWNEQAAKKAASYLRSGSFDRSGLIDQLEYEGFTYEQALYGVQSSGL